jgi:hypothetical protein
MKWVRHVACMTEKRSIYNIFVGKHEVKRPLGRPRCRWEFIIIKNLKEIV